MLSLEREYLRNVTTFRLGVSCPLGNRPKQCFSHPVATRKAPRLRSEMLPWLIFNQV